MPYFLKRLSAINFVSYHRFDYPHGMSVSKKHHNQFLASLSGRLVKLILHGACKNSQSSNSLQAPWHFTRYAHVREARNSLKGVFLSHEHTVADCLNLGKTANNHNSRKSFSRNTWIFLFKDESGRICTKVPIIHKKAIAKCDTRSWCVNIA